MKKLFFGNLLLVLLVLAPAGLTFAQKGLVDERNVRAEMYFLASDAMQGRGSGSPWEHATAEYVGSQFMQFGLEAAGEAGFDGKPTYVQTVDVAGRENMTNLKIDNGTGADVVYGRDWAAFGMTVFPSAHDSLYAVLLVTSGWLNVTPYAWRLVGVNAFALAGHSLQRFAALTSFAGTVALTAGWIGLLMGWL